MSPLGWRKSTQGKLHSSLLSVRSPSSIGRETAQPLNRLVVDGGEVGVVLALVAPVICAWGRGSEQQNLMEQSSWGREQHSKMERDALWYC